MSNVNGTIEFAKRSAVVVFERDTGTIVHVHECWTERGARHPAKRAMEKEALSFAAEERGDLDRRQVGLIHVEPERLVVNENETLEVDVARKRLKKARISNRARRIG